MKRKRGKKGILIKNPKVDMMEEDPSTDNLSTEEVSGPDDTEKDETSSRMDIETPSSTGTDQPEKPVAVSSTGILDKPVGRLVYNRVKVKIKSSKPLEPQLTSSDAHTHSDTDKSSQHAAIDKQVVNDKVEDSANSVPESSAGFSTTPAKKTGSIKIKTSKGFGSNLSPCTSSGVVQVQAQAQAQAERTHQREPESLSRDSVYNKQELNTSLEVIKKIMKMDAAEPFNAPVNPIALGIPDYFDVIKTPMDFGTICSTLESGLKYKNSEDVYKDVQYIWDNCYKYNSKGDYILELMKRVKKNFSKYWTAAGLYTEQQQGEHISSHGKPHNKGGHTKHKSRKRHGVKRHKDDCLCAICVMMRRRKEREQVAHSTDDQMETSEGAVQEVKTEGTSPVESPNGDDTSSSTDNSQNPDADAEMEDKGEEVKLEDLKELHSELPSKKDEKEKETSPVTNGEHVIAAQSQPDDRSRADKDEDIQMVEAGSHTKNDTDNEEKANETPAIEHQKHKELLDSGEKAKIYKNLCQHYENPAVLKLCGSLFPGTPKPVWSGPHSLVHRHGSSRSTSIGAAIARLMK